MITFAAKMKTFSELGLSDALLSAIAEQGYETPMPIQEEVIPWLTEADVDNQHSDLIALAQTGTGKTAAYGLPLLQLLSSEENLGEGKHVRALVLAPTRELCIQIAEDLQDFSRYLPHISILAVYGGAGIEPQMRALRHGVDIVVATPGRLMDLMNRGVADLSLVHYVVLDEADEMLSMGFQEDLNAILEGVPSNHRTLLFSATMSKEIERIAKRYLNEAHQIQVGSRNEGSENVNHIYYMVRAKDKYAALKRVVDYYPRIYAIIFCRTKAETQEVADNLIRDGYNADALHGDLSQQQRDLTMQKFRHHRTQLLVATDVAARGLDVDDLTHVINYGLPDDVESYTHRSGRTGRAGKKGTSISIVNMRERSRIRQVEKQIQKSFAQGTLPEPREICSKQLYHVIDDIERVEVDEEEIAPFMSEVQKRWEWLDIEDSSGMTVSEIRAKCRRLATKEPGLAMVVIDYLQLIQGGAKYEGNRQQEVSEISRSLKTMAMELKIPVIALAQLSRSVELRENKRPIMSDLRESGSIEQDADIVAFLYRDDYYNKSAAEQSNVSVTELILGKHRNGSTGTIELLFERDMSNFRNYIKKNEEK